MTTEAKQPLSTHQHHRYQDVIGLLSAAGPGFSGPVGIALGPDGLLYVANRANPNQPEAVRITKCTKDGDYVDQFGEWGREPGRFIWVTDIEFNHRGELYLSDEETNRVSAFSTDGQLVRSFGQPGRSDGHWERPSGIAFDSNDNLFVVDALNHRVQVLSPEGRFLSTWGSQGSGQVEFNMPWGIAIDGEDRVFVTDWRNDRVQIFSTDGNFQMAFGHTGSGEGEFNRPNGIAVDQTGDIYVCDWMNDRVQVFDAQGDFKDVLIGHAGNSKWARTFLDANPDIEEKLDSATQNIEQKTRFYRPTSVKVDQDGRVFVADCYRHRVQVYQRLGG